MAQETNVAVDKERYEKFLKYEEAQKRAAEQSRRNLAKDRIFVAKAMEARITVSEQEITDYLNRKKK